MLPPPLPLAKRGEYAPDVKIEKLYSSPSLKKFSYVSNTPYSRHLYDAIAWFEQVGLSDLQKRTDNEGSNNSSNHACAPKDQTDVYCKICGTILDENYKNSALYVNIPIRCIQTIINPNEIRGLEVVSIKRPTDSKAANEFLMYVVDTLYLSVTDRYKLTSVIPKTISTLLTTRIIKSVSLNEVLIFDSSFECGNLASANYIKKDEYDIYLHNDTNTRGHTQWFFFSASTYELKDNRRFTFNIRNMCKGQGLFNNGQKIYALSMKNRDLENCTWSMVDDFHSYSQNELQRQLIQVSGDKQNDDCCLNFNDVQLMHNGGESTPTVKGQPQTKKKEHSQQSSRRASVVNDDSKVLQKKLLNFQTLSFSYTFPHEFDKVYFAYFVPYTFTNLIDFLKETEKQVTASKIQKQLQHNSSKVGIMHSFEPITIVTSQVVYKREKICSTISGLPVYMLTITAPARRRKDQSKKGIFLCARVHPGESNSSFIIQGLIKYLIGDSAEAKRLRNYYVFKIIPMLNPEGVAFGNNRTSLCGADLNRRWLDPDERLHPEIFSTKEALKQFQKEREVLVFCDIHGHSKKKNAFMYGCSSISEGGLNSWTKVRLLPKIFTKRSKMFSMKDCMFKITPDKVGTARVVVWKELRIFYSFTLEVSLYGYNDGENIIPFDVKSLEQLGVDFCLSLQDLYHITEKFDLEVLNSNGSILPVANPQKTARQKIDTTRSVYSRSSSGVPRRPKMVKKVSSEQETILTQKYNDTYENEDESSESSTSEIEVEEDYTKRSITEDGKDSTRFGSTKLTDRETVQDWRDYFDADELNNTFEMIQQGRNPSDMEEEGSDADSDSSQSRDDQETHQAEIEFIEAALKIPPKPSNIAINKLAQVSPSCVINSSKLATAHSPTSKILSPKNRVLRQPKKIEEAAINSQTGSEKPQNQKVKTPQLSVEPSQTEAKNKSETKISFFQMTRNLSKSVQSKSSPKNNINPAPPLFQDFQTFHIQPLKPNAIKNQRHSIAKARFTNPNSAESKSAYYKENPNANKPGDEKSILDVCNNMIQFGAIHSKDHTLKHQSFSRPYKEYSVSKNYMNRTIDLEKDSSPGPIRNLAARSNFDNKDSLARKTANSVLEPMNHGVEVKNNRSIFRQHSNEEDDSNHAHRKSRSLLQEKVMQLDQSSFLNMLAINNEKSQHTRHSSAAKELLTEADPKRVLLPKRNDVSFIHKQKLKRYVGDLFKNLVNPNSEKSKSAMIREKILNSDSPARIMYKTRGQADNRQHSITPEKRVYFPIFDRLPHALYLDPRHHRRDKINTHMHDLPYY